MKSLTDFPDARLRIFERPELSPPGDVRSVHLVGICGTGMGSLAGLFHEAGYDVRGSDSGVWPPMSTRLQALGIPFAQTFDPDNLVPRPDLVVIGNACIPTHPEATYARVHALMQASFPEALTHFFIRDRRSLVVAGTHGKTTTTAMLIHIFRTAGLDPGYLVGGVLENNEPSQQVGTGRHFLVEGDEYDTAYFDKRPKFLHYRPTSAIVTSIEFDHADIYDSLDDVRAAFVQFAESVSREGVLVVCGDDTHAAGLNHPNRIVYGLACDSPDMTATELESTSEGIRFRTFFQGESIGVWLLPMHGSHNLLNALGAGALALSEGIKPNVIGQALRSFPGVQRRQQIRGESGGVVVLDDFAHHPSAVRATIAATRDRWPDRRLVAVFEPRSNSSRRKVFQNAYSDAFSAADAVFLSTPLFRHNDSREDFMDVATVLSELRAHGVRAQTADGADLLLPLVLAAVRPGDVVLVMSNGGFGNIHERLLTALQTAFPEDAEHTE